MTLSPTLFHMPVLVLFGAVLFLAPTQSGGAPRSSSHHPFHHHLHGPQGLLTRTSYRPRIKAAAFDRKGSLANLTAEFSTRRGFTNRIEVRIDGKVFAAADLSSPVTKGSVKFRIDLSKAGPGKHEFRLWAWQGRQGYQSVHGESTKLTFSN